MHLQTRRNTGLTKLRKVGRGSEREGRQGRSSRKVVWAGHMSLKRLLTNQRTSRLTKRAEESPSARLRIRHASCATTRPHPCSLRLCSDLFHSIVMTLNQFFSRGLATLRGFVRPFVGLSIHWSVSTSRKVEKHAFPPLPTCPRLVLAVYPALLDRFRT